MSESSTSTEKRIPPILPIEDTEAQGAVTGARYLESLRDDREIWYRGERVKDVTTHPELREMARSPMDRYKLCKLAWELTGDAFGSRQQLYERLHSGDPNMMVAMAYRKFDLSKGIDLVSKFLDIKNG